MLATKANLLSIAIENTLRQKILRRGPRSWLHKRTTCNH